MESVPEAQIPQYKIYGRVGRFRMRLELILEEDYRSRGTEQSAFNDVELITFVDLITPLV